MTPREVLLKAAEMVERGWCQGMGARNAAGREVRPTSRAAVCWCAHGAILRSAKDGVGWLCMEHLARAIGIAPCDVTGWNDAPKRTQAEVVSALKAAAEACD